MDMQSPGQKQTEINTTVATTTSSAAIPISMVTSSHPACTQATAASLSAIPPGRQSIQMIQQAVHRPQSIAAQYLHQMYAAQQQHLMLQTAALQQRQHTPHLQSLSTIQQASVCQRQSPASSSGTLAPLPGVVSQNSVTLPASPAAAQLIARTQNSTATTTSISQQAMLLGNRPANCNQTQMYLRTQMLILTPAATVAAVQSDLPAVTSSSSLHPSAQVHSLALHAQLPRTLAAAHSVILKPSIQSQTVSPATSVSKPAICALKVNQMCDAATETSPPEVTQPPPGHTGAGCSPAQTHILVKQQQASQHRIVLQNTGGAPNNRQFQPIALRASPQEDHSSHQAAPPSNGDQTPPAPSVASVSAHTPIQNVTAKLQPPPLLAAPHRRTSVPVGQNQPTRPPPPPPPHLPLVLDQLPQNPPATPQRLSVHSVQALAVQSGRVLLTEHELPVAEALIQMPYQNLPPPQTMAVDLKVHPVRQSQTPTETCTVNGLRSEENKEQRSPNPQWKRTTALPTVCPKQGGEAVMDSSSTLSGHSVIRSPVVEESPLDTSRTAPPPPPSILPAAVLSSSHPPSPPASTPGSPNKLLRSQILTHLIEGFIIQEGLEPFPVGHSAAEHQATLPESQEIQTIGDAAPEDSLQDAEQSDSTDWEMQNDSPAADELREKESVAHVLQCEQCGNPGYASTFLCSKRFCSLTCARRSRVRCTKPITMERAGRWAHGFIGRRGRPPSRINGASRENVLRQTYKTFGSKDSHQGSPREEEEPAIPPMTTRLRRQTERERERQRLQEREQEQRMTEPPRTCDGEEEFGRPLRWNVEQVFSYINSLPEGQDAAREFRRQEIDGQALLLLTEDHLISTMNLKLGPALKLCAHINSLKDA